MKHASIVITAEHNAPLYKSEEQALAATGNKRGSGHDCRWAIWQQVGEDVTLLAFNIPTLSIANERAHQYAKEICAALGTANAKVIRS